MVGFIPASMRRLTVTVRKSGFVELLNDDGAWVGPGVGGFSKTSEVREWARSNGYTVARSINRVERE